MASQNLPRSSYAETCSSRFPAIQRFHTPRWRRQRWFIGKHEATRYGDQDTEACLLGHELGAASRHLVADGRNTFVSNAPAWRWPPACGRQSCRPAAADPVARPRPSTHPNAARLARLLACAPAAPLPTGYHRARALLVPPALTNVNLALLAHSAQVIHRLGVAAEPEGAKT